jgi:seryl-tRNA synthetase
MKKLFITALFALFMGGFAITANAQGKVTETKKTNGIVKQDDKVSLNQNLIDAFQKAVNTFEADINKCKEGKNTDKINLEGDMNDAKTAYQSVKNELKNLTKKQSDTFKELEIKYNNLIMLYKELKDKH